MSIPRRMGRLARGLVSNFQEDERFRDTLRVGRERGETLRKAFEAARKGASEEWRRAEERREEERRRAENGAAGEGRAAGDGAFGWRSSSSSPTGFPLRRYPPSVLAAYDRLGLVPGVPMEEVDKKRRELVKKFHPDRFSDPGKRARAERVTAEINAAHDAVERHLTRHDVRV